MSKKTGELKLFREIWKDRKHRCTVCDKRLAPFSVTYFAHVLSKGAYPSLRLDPSNIVLMCYQHHTMYDHQTDKAKEDSRFDFVFELAEQKKADYYSRPNYMKF